jgi:4-amino-4-deoxy-L-arabinose transferase-like glycosyltransferase
MDDVDSLHAEAAREMLQRHDFVTMYADGVRYLDKAPFLYWVTAASYAAFGFTEFATRLPLTLFVLAGVLAVFYLARDIGGEDAGLLAGLVWVTAVGPYIYTRFLIPDLVVTLWLTVTVHLLLRTFDGMQPSRALCWSLGAVTAVNVLTKGLIGVVFPIAILGCYLLITGNWGHLRKLRLVSTSVVFLLIAVPWHWLATVRNPPEGQAKGFFWFYFINEQVNRYLNKRIPRDYDKVPLWIFWGLALVFLLPWSGYLVAALRQLPVRWRNLRSEMTREQRASLLMVIWALVILVFFSFSTRQEYYLLPALPALAVLTGIWLAKEQAAPAGDPAQRLGGKMAIFLLVLGVVICGITVPLAIVSHPLPPGTSLAEALRQSTQMYTLSTGHLFDLTATAMGAFRFPLLLTGVAFLLGTGLSWYYRRKLRWMRANLSLALMMVAVLYAVHLALTVFSPVLGSRELADAIKQNYRPADVIVLDGEYTIGSSINFYTGLPVHMLNGNKYNLWYGSLFPDCPPVFHDDASFNKLWMGPQRVFLVTFSQERRQYFSHYTRPAYEVARSGDKAVLSNQASPSP